VTDSPRTAVESTVPPTRGRSLVRGPRPKPALVLGVLLLTLLVVYPYLASVYWLSLMTTILIYGVFAMSLDLLMGYAGSASFGHAAFFGIGAYTTALVNIHHSASLWLDLGASVLVAAAAALVIGALCARSSGVYFLMLTLALAQLVYSFSISSAAKFAGGADGLPGVRRPTLAPVPLTIDFMQPRSFYFLTLVFLVVSFFVLLVLVRSPFGRSLVGIRENEGRMRALGYVTWRYRLAAFVIAGAVAGAAGSLFAYQRLFTSPDILFWATSGFALVMVIIGGIGTLVGSLFGAAVYVILQDYVSSYTSRWQIIFGAVFIVFVFVARDGLVGIARRAARVGARVGRPRAPGPLEPARE
jgi:branched-chain amino acid transport system permease protein